MLVSTISGALPETWREFCVFTWTTQFVVDRVPCFQSSVNRFPPRKWQVGQGMFCGSKYAQNKDNKDIMITHTEFAVTITKVSNSPARKKMRDDLADKAEIHAFRGGSGSISWLAGQTRPDGSSQVSQLQQTLPLPTVAQVCGSSMVVRRVHQHAVLGLKIRRIPVQNMMLLVGCSCFVEHWRSGWLTGWLYLWCYRQVIAGRMRVVSNGLEIVQNDSDSTQLLGRRSTSHVCSFGLCRVGNSFSARVDPGTN